MANTMESMVRLVPERLKAKLVTGGNTSKWILALVLPKDQSEIMVPSA